MAVRPALSLCLIVSALLSILIGCGQSVASPSSAGSPSSSGSAFTSPMYLYSLILPPDWQSKAATKRWDGSGSPGHLDPDVDIVEPMTGAMSVFVFAAPTTLGLAAYTTDTVARNAAFHGDTCPKTPETTETTTAGGEAASFLAWNCGLLINAIVVVHAGVGYEFSMRDPAVKGATDPTDRKAFDGLLMTLSFGR